jgi:3-oxoadipate enol-lactonase
MASFPAQNYTIAYSVTENAWTQDLVFLNGNLATSRWWMPTIEALKPLVANTPKTGRFIFLELPGCGDGSLLVADLNVGEIVDSYMALLNSLNVKKAALIGHSTGGLLSCLMMAQNPEIFVKALLLDPVGAKGIQFEDSVLEKYEEMKTNRELTAFIIGFTIHNCDTQSAFFNDIIVEDTMKSVNNAGSRMIRALRGISFEEEIKKIKTPTTVLFGEKDILLPKADAQDLAKIIPVSKFIEVPEAGHCLNIENPRKMAEFIQAELI